MSRSVDERVVSMQFDNKQFESGVQTSLKSINNLKKSLNFDSAAKSFSQIEKSSHNVNLSSLQSSVEAIASRFTNLGIIGVTALQNITNSAIRTGEQLIKSLTVEPVLTGFTEYETKMNSIQTILTNTASKGTTLDDVNKALNELNKYADQTIYNFADMTRNIGAFTAAGVDLDTSVASIKGIANLAAGSGSTPQQAATAMYQLSQAIAAGRVSLQDWNSVVNAGMGGEYFRNALKQTAREMGIVVDESESFRESISTAGGKESWLTSDVLTTTLAKFANDENLVKAATQVRTFTQLIDTMKESVQSGWATSWEHIIGDSEQATKVLTSISEAFKSIIQPSTDARNASLKFWNENGGREDAIKGLTNVFKTLGTVLSSIGDSFKEVFPSVTGQNLVDISKRFLNLTENFKIGESTLDRLKRTFKGLFSVISLFGKGVKTLLSPVGNLFNIFGMGADSVLGLTASIGDFFTKLNESKNTDEIFQNLSESLNNATGSFGKFIESIKTKTPSVSSFLERFSDGASDLIEKAGTKLSEVIRWISENVTFKDVFAGLAGGGLFALATKLGGLFKKITDILDGFFGDKAKSNSLKEQFSDILSSVHDSIDSFTTGIKTASLVSIAVSIGILSASLTSLSKIKAGDIAKSLTAIGVLMAELSLTFKSVSKTINTFDTGGVIKAGISMIAISGALSILASAMQKISSIDTAGVIKGLVSIGTLMLELTGFLKVTDLKGASLKGSVALVVIAEAISLLSKSLTSLSGLSWEELAKGLVAVGGSLLELSASIKIIGKTSLSVKTILGVIAIAESCKIMADALSALSILSWDEIGRGLTAMGGALAELTAVTSVLGKFGSFGSLAGGASIYIISNSLSAIADALSSFGTMNWSSIGRGLVAMGVALGELGTVAGVLGKVAGFSGIFGSTSILIIAQSLKPIYESLSDIGGMEWGTIGKGIVGLGVALGELALIVGVLGKVAPIGGLLGSGAILLGVQSLKPLADAMDSFSSMSWEEIGKALVAMGAALGELALIAGLLGKVAPLSILGSGSLLLGIQGLGQLADALAKFGSMEWGEIGKGLTAMIGAMGAAGLGGLLNTLSGLGANAIAEVAAPLGTLADSVSKWKDVKVPFTLPIQMGQLAAAIMTFTFSGFGANALSTAAPGVSQMADAVKKWGGVKIPNGLDIGMKTIADGVQAFSFAFMGGWSLSAVAEPLGKLAGSVKKWNGVAIPKDLDKGLKKLSDGVGSFSFAFAGGWSIGSIVDPLKKLAEAVKSWNNVSIPENLDESLKKLSDAIKSFSVDNFSTGSMSSISSGMDSLTNSAKTLASIDFAGLSSGIGQFVSAVQNLPNQVSDASSKLVASVEFMSAAISSKSGSVTDAFSRLMNNAVTTVNSNSTKLDSAGKSAINTFINGISETFSSGTQKAKNSVTTMFNSMIDSISTVISKSKGSIQNGGAEIMNSFLLGLLTNSGGVQNTFSFAVALAKSKISEYNDDFYSAGADLTQGLANGILSKRSSAINAAAQVAADSLNAARKELDSHSPSRKFEKLGKDSDQGLANGFLALMGRVGNASRKVANNSLMVASSSLDKITSILNSDLDTTARITPIINGGYDYGTFTSGFNKSIIPRLSFNPVDLNLTGKKLENNKDFTNNSKDYGQDIVDSVNSLQNTVSDLGDKIEQIQIVLDTGTLVGELTPGIDEKLGKLNIRARRRN